MMNIFYSFNPTNFNFYSWFLLNMMMLNMFFLSNIINNCKHFIIYSKFYYFINSDFSKINKSKINNNILFLMFFMIALINLLDMMPYSFCLNSQINLFMFFSLLMWLSCFMYSMGFYFYKTIIHLTPLSCPYSISPFMVLIELISMMIRPITLSVRMSANLLAGHLLIHLLNEFTFFMINNNTLNMLYLMIMIIMLTIMELCVSLIQSYIFFSLINMYICENM